MLGLCTLEVRADVPQLSGMTVVTAPAGTPVAAFGNGYNYDLRQNLSVRADAVTGVGSVVFTLDGRYVRTENVSPYAVGGDVYGSYTVWKPAAGNHTLVATPHSQANASGVVGPSISVSFIALSNPASTIRINCGGSDYWDSLGQKWSADTDFSGGSVYSSGQTGIAGTRDPTLYRTERYAQTLIYNIPLTNGTYKVTFDFAEIYFNSAGRRVFNVALQGQTVLQNIDIYALVGSNTAFQRSFSVPVNNGLLKIAGTASVNNAKFSAIEVTPISGGPTPTPTPTATPKPTPTPTATPKPTPTPTATPKPTPTPTPTPTPITSVTLAWNASASADVAGYHVSYGTVSHTYTQRVNVGNKTTASITGLSSGRTYYFVVSAYDSSGLESLPSNEVSFTTSSSGSAASTDARNTGIPGSSGPGAPPSSGSAPNYWLAPRAANSPFVTNFSSRVHVGFDNNVAIVGFTICGTGQKTIVARALGPSLSKFGIEQPLEDPMLVIHDATGRVIASNDNWRESQQGYFATGGAYHGLQPVSDLEAALVLNLPPGAYTMVVSGKNSGQGVGLAEIYDFSQNTTSTLTNISTRAQVLTGDDVLIGGITIRDSGLRLVLRALGPTLTRFGVAQSLQNPTMALYNSNGTLLRSSGSANASDAAQLLSSGYAPGDPREAAMIALLPAGTYTAVVRGESDITGTALFEAYALQQTVSAAGQQTPPQNHLPPDRSGGQ